MVYRAQDLRLGRRVALKVLPPATAQDEEAVERFRREARTASSLNHPNICTIYSFDEHNGQFVLAMELLEGETLDRRLSGRSMPVRDLLDVGDQISDALDAAHGEGILHRDIKPANIFMTRRGPVKVLDFGLAKFAPALRRSDASSDNNQTLAHSEHFTSMAGTTVGTIAYMSPEQARAEELDQRSDLFSFGVVLYEMATGRQSFPGSTTAVIFDGILNRDPPPPSSINPGVPVELDRIISKALEKDRSLRYQTAGDVRSDIRRLKRDSSSMRIAVPVQTQTDEVTAYVAPQPAATQPVPTMHTAQPTMPAMAPARPALAPASPNTTTVQAPATVPAAAGPKKFGQPTVMLVGGLVALVALVAVLAVVGTRWMSSTPAATVTTLPPAATDPTTPTEPAPPPAATTDPGATTPPPTTPPATVAPTDPGTAKPPTGPSGTPPNATGGPSGSVPPATTKRPTPADPKLTPTAPAATPAEPTPEAPPPPPATPAPSPADVEATRRMEIARTKLNSNLQDQAVADLRQIVRDFPQSSTAADASFLAAEVLEKMGRVEDAMAAHLEFGNRFSSDARMASSKLRLADLTLKSRHANKETAALDLYGQIIRDYPKTPSTLQALQSKARIETERRLETKDPVLNGKQVPAALITLRTLTEQFPEVPATMTALNRLGQLYIEEEEWLRAVHALTDLANRFPNNPHDAWFRVGELYERRLNDRERARAAYLQVAPSSQRYRDAQRRAQQK